MTNNIQKWEYKEVYFIDEEFPNERILNEYGSEGWELVAILPGQRDLTGYFKRPIKEENNEKIPS